MTGSNERIEVDGCDTIPKLFWHQVQARGERTAFREKDLGIWRATSWRDYGERAKAAGMGLVKFGLSHGQVVSVLDPGGPGVQHEAGLVEIADQPRCRPAERCDIAGIEAHGARCAGEAGRVRRRDDGCRSRRGCVR